MNRIIKAACLAIAAVGLVIAPAAFAPAFAQTMIKGLDGDWSGALDVQGQSVPLVLHISTSDDATTATLDSPAQGQAGIPVSKITRNGDRMTFEIEVAAGAYEGDIAPDGASVTGMWRQNGFELELVLTRQ